ncbi:MAG: hypothetical protein ACO1PW_06380 [Actinomycetota bacterium]
MTHRWTDDDDLLVIDLYLRHGASGADRTEVRTLARLIGTTPASIASALANVLHLDTGRGLPNYAEHMRAMWEHWGHRPAEVAIEARAIRIRMETDARQGDVTLTPEQQARVDARLAARRRDRKI